MPAKNLIFSRLSNKSTTLLELVQLDPTTLLGTLFKRDVDGVSKNIIMQYIQYIMMNHDLTLCKFRLKKIISDRRPEDTWNISYVTYVYSYIYELPNHDWVHYRSISDLQKCEHNVQSSYRNSFIDIATPGNMVSCDIRALLYDNLHLFPWSSEYVFSSDNHFTDTALQRMLMLGIGSARKVLSFFNAQLHWVLLSIDFVNRDIFIYDTLEKEMDCLEWIKKQWKTLSNLKDDHWSSRSTLKSWERMFGTEYDLPKERLRNYISKCDSFDVKHISIGIQDEDKNNCGVITFIRAVRLLLGYSAGHLENIEKQNYGRRFLAEWMLQNGVFSKRDIDMGVKIINPGRQKIMKEYDFSPQNEEDVVDGFLIL
jgi:hypothetical protein